MAGYTGFQKKKSKLGLTLAIVAIVHVGLGAGLYWLSTTEFGKEMIRVYKLNMSKQQEPPAETPPEPPKPEEPPPPPKPEQKPKQDAPPPEPVAAPPPEPGRVEAARPPQVDANPFAIGKGRGKFAGYADLVTASIQQHYSQPAELPEELDYAVLCQLLLDDEGQVLEYRLLNSSGSVLFDRSALEALAKVGRVRPPPAGMDHTLVVKFFPP